jgi:hypothetical protein
MPQRKIINIKHFEHIEYLVLFFIINFLHIRLKLISADYIVSIKFHYVKIKIDIFQFMDPC